MQVSRKLLRRYLWMLRWSHLFPIFITFSHLWSMVDTIIITGLYVFGVLRSKVFMGRHQESLWIDWVLTGYSNIHQHTCLQK
jgi:hypothetical protein